MSRHLVIGPGRKYVIIKRDSKYATCAQGGSGKIYTTLLMCTSASGKFLPPYIIYRAPGLCNVWMPRNYSLDLVSMQHNLNYQVFHGSWHSFRMLATTPRPPTYQSNTTDFVSDKATSNTNISTLRRSSACPNISSNVYASNQQDISSTNDMSPIAAIDTSKTFSI
ncbi:unnamed protein product [Rotaria socialis]|uniref:Uncharacterized protein n=1 Tax=Rotaria socialis TaxID=392032 RepID=A0A820P1Q2_9BILA|nr:unnamed protein product [Rotaria socialis]